MSTELTKEFIDQNCYRLDENTEKIGKCLDMLTEDEIWKHPNHSSNSIGNLILHLCGNIRQYAISSLSGTEDVRERDKEFSKQAYVAKKELFEKLAQTVDEAKHVIEQADVDNLLRKRHVQGYHFSGMGIIIHVTEHYSYHTGQIALLTKLWKNEDLGFYAGIDLNVKNE